MVTVAASFAILVTAFLVLALVGDLVLVPVLAFVLDLLLEGLLLDVVALRRTIVISV